jgi:hypothetical protein
MDGIGYFMVSMAGFVVGGVLNLCYLLAVAITFRSYFAFENRWKRLVARTGFAGSILLLVFQLVVVSLLIWRQSTMH